jgi:hypothetical protein
MWRKLMSAASIIGDQCEIHDAVKVHPLHSRMLILSLRDLHAHHHYAFARPYLCQLFGLGDDLVHVFRNVFWFHPGQLEINAHRSIDTFRRA